MTRGLRLRATTWLVALAMLTGVIPGGWGAVCATAAEPGFMAPVKGPITRRFEPPLGPYAAGHRGIDFGVPAGTEVVASGDGVVAFAGPVAGDGMFVTISHNEFVQTTYSFMSQVSVTARQKVRMSEPIGLSGSGHPEGGGPVLHFGLKVGGQYMDPEILLLGELDDISDLISLAPIADEYDRFLLDRGGQSASARAGTSRLAEPEKPWHIKLGGMIAGFGRSVKDVTLGAVNWTKDKALEVGKFVGGVLGFVGRGSEWAFNGAKSVFKSTGKAIGDFLGGVKDFFVGAGRGLRIVASRVGDFARSVARSVGNFLESAARNVGDFLSSAAHSVGNFLGSAAHAVGEFVESAVRTVGDFLGSAARTVRVFLGWEARTAGDFLAWAAGNVGDFVHSAAQTAGEVARWVGDQVIELGERINEATRWLASRVIWLGDRFNDVGRSLFDGTKWLSEKISQAFKSGVGSLWDSINKSFLVGMTKGAIEQIKCSLEGGAPPPDLPTSEELENGVEPPPPPNDNIVVAIGGIGSHTAGKNGAVVPGASMYQMDFRTLGFSEDQVFFYSYRGIEDRGGPGPYGFHAPYTKEDTYRSIRDAAALLRRQIEKIHELYPDKEIDLVAHSQGGLVAQYYVSFLHDVDNQDGLTVDHFVSIASPHYGADAAQVHRLLSDTQMGKSTLEQLDSFAEILGSPPPSSTAAREMAENSPFILELNENWDPRKVKATAITDTFDLVVTSQHTRLEKAAHYTVDMPGDSWRRPLHHHGDVVSAASTREILYNALADTPSECTALRNAFADNGAGRLISGLEDAAAGLIDVMTEAQP